jgi:Protein of unknown function (DUF3443)
VLNMMRNQTSWLAFLPIIALSCGGSTAGNQGAPGGDGGAGTGDSGGTTSDGGATTSDGGGTTTEGGGPTYDGAVPTGNNVAPMIVDNGPAGAGGSVDVPFVSVTVCAPGTSTCQTIDHVSVDTGSSGLRIISSVLTITLPQQKASTGDSLAECFTFEDGYVWGSVRLADVKIAGEVAANIPLQLVGDSAFPTVPSDCSSTGSPEDTVPDFGANGIIGINQIVADCGSYCATAQSAGYYSCTGSTCTDVGLAVASQISNPIAAFTQDNNGAVMEFAAVPAAGAATASGSLVFGVGTQSNNALGSALVLTTDGDGNFTTIFNGQTLSMSYIDSGTNSLSFNDSSITPCSSQEASGFFCPKSTVSLSAENKGLNGVTSTVTFSIANTDTLFATNDTAFNDLGGPGSTGSFAWGFPFFLGRAVFLALQGAMTPGGVGPYYAY